MNWGHFKRYQSTENWDFVFEYRASFEAQVNATGGPCRATLTFSQHPEDKWPLVPEAHGIVELSDHRFYHKDGIFPSWTIVRHLERGRHPEVHFMDCDLVFNEMMEEAKAHILRSGKTL